MGRAGAGGGRRMSSGGSSMRRTGGGHSPGRVGGGHSVGKSGFGGKRAGSGSSRISPPPPRNHGPRRRYGRYSAYHGVGCGGGLISIIILGVILIGILAMFGRCTSSKKWQNPVTSSSNSENPAKNTTDHQEKANAREKLNTSHEYINDCVIDELGWFDDVSETERQLKDFWEKTGVQPYIILRNYDASLTSDSEKEQWAIDYYDDNFDTENIFLFVYFAEKDTDNDVGYMAYANGYDTTSVMDSDAVDIFWDNIDKYWYTDLSTDDVLIRAFNDTADGIM